MTARVAIDQLDHFSAVHPSKVRVLDSEGVESVAPFFHQLDGLNVSQHVRGTSYGLTVS
jgi:hypothetical protein